MSFKIYHDDDYLEIIDKINSQLKIYNLRFEFEEGEFDGYDVVKLKTIVHKLSKLIKLSDLNTTNSLYTQETLEKILEQYNQMVKEGQPVVGEINNPYSSSTIKNLYSISHKVTSIHLNEDGLLVEIEFVDTPAGKIITNAMNSFGEDVVGIIPRFEDATNNNFVTFDIDLSKWLGYDKVFQ